MTLEQAKLGIAQLRTYHEREITKVFFTIGSNDWSEPDKYFISVWRNNITDKFECLNSYCSPEEIDDITFKGIHINIVGTTIVNAISRSIVADVEMQRLVISSRYEAYSGIVDCKQVIFFKPKV
jgi:hypothetical protein